MNKSIWSAYSGKSAFPSLAGDRDCDVVIIGGGITGITTAMLLSQAGKSVIVLEAGETGLGTTGYSTGNLYANVDSLISRIASKWDDHTARAVLESRADTLRFVEHTIAAHRVDCGFFRRPLYLISLSQSDDDLLEQEREKLSGGGLSPVSVDRLPLPFSASWAIRLEEQAQFNPLIYVRIVAREIASAQCSIFENSKVIRIDHDSLTVSTEAGTVRARKIVMATHIPKGFNILQTELGPYREYGIAAKLSDDRYPDGIFWTIDDPGYSFRSCNVDGQKFLMVIGEKHKTGQHEDGIDYFKRVEDFVRSRFPVSSLPYRWSAQHYRPADGLPYIGRTAASDDLYVATGFGTDGLIYGSLAARIIADDITGRHNQWAALYRSTRFKPVKSAKDFIAENVNVAGQYMKDYIVKREASSLTSVRPGEGSVVQIDGNSVASYLHPSGDVTNLSPVCTHLGCMVRWNGMEKSWDCPCHGSRFQPEGEVIEGPAITALPRKQSGEE